MGRREWLGWNYWCFELPVRRGGRAALMVEVNPKMDASTQRSAKRL